MSDGGGAGGALMEAMILAAGKGTRLAPLTDSVPKALVRVGGRPLLEWAVERVVAAGASRIIVNAHHHEEQIRAWVRGRPPGGPEIVLSPEPGGPYDTGGGLFAAAPLFREPTPFLLHNVDVLSGIPLADLVARHREAAARCGEPVVASLAVQARETGRALLFDDLGLMGWENRGSDRGLEGSLGDGEEGRRVREESPWVREESRRVREESRRVREESPRGREESRRVREPRGEVRRLSFSGIHVVEPRIFGLSARRGTFSIITLYLELAAAGCRILADDVSAYPWIDVGTPARLEAAEGMARTFMI